MRRYLCVACGAVICVGPRDVAPRYLYSGAAIAWAVALWAMTRSSRFKVRQRVSIWQRVGASAQGGWQTLGRWLRDCAGQRLFAGLPLHHAHGLPPRQLAERIAMSIAARAPPTLAALSLTDRVFRVPHAVWLGAVA